MQDFAFYHVGCENAKGPKGLLIIARRLARRVLRPFFLRQVEIFQYFADLLDNHENRIFALRHDTDEMRNHQAQLAHQHSELSGRQDSLSARQDELADQIQTTMAFGWDYVAMVRRLATLEDQLARLTGTSSSPSEEGDNEASILFPGLEKASRKPASDDDQIRSKVC